MRCVGRSPTEATTRWSPPGGLADFRCCYRQAIAAVDRRLTARRAELLGVEPGDDGQLDRALSRCSTEINFDGIIGPSHNYAGLSLGNHRRRPQRGRGQRAARRGAAGRRQDARQSGAGAGAGLLRAARRPNAGWLAALGTDLASADRASARRALVRLVDVGRQCRDRLACARHRRRPLPPDRRQPASPCRTAATNGPVRWRSCGWPSPIRALCGARARPAAVRRRGRGQPHAAVRRARRARRRDLRLWRRRRPLPRAPASSRRAKAIARHAWARSGAHAVHSARARPRSPPVRSTTTSSRSPTNGPVRPRTGVRGPRGGLCRDPRRVSRRSRSSRYPPAR